MSEQSETAPQLTVFVCDSCGYARVAWSHSQRPAECINHHPLREVEYVPLAQAEREKRALKEEVARLRRRLDDAMRREVANDAPLCSCRRFCADVAEEDDDPTARCKGLRPEHARAALAKEDGEG